MLRLVPPICEENTTSEPTTAPTSAKNDMNTHVNEGSAEPLSPKLDERDPNLEAYMQLILHKTGPELVLVFSDSWPDGIIMSQMAFIRYHSLATRRELATATHVAISDESAAMTGLELITISELENKFLNR